IFLLSKYSFKSSVSTLPIPRPPTKLAMSMFPPELDTQPLAQLSQNWPKKSNRRIFHFGKSGDFVATVGAQDGT
ncbi:hypothetical protein LJC46_07885, partial [Desulfovibrio sp. OttesenSCG-928-G15]|nr:hypothetical protein [Desulfovibrio sp. OttesenSCG-928-G15]